MKLCLAVYRSIELNNTSDGNSHAVSIHPVCDIKRRTTALHLAGKGGKIHPVDCDEGVLKDAPDKRIELFQLLVSRSGSKRQLVASLRRHAGSIEILQSPPSQVRLPP